MFYNQESTTAMEKVRKYSSFEAMKDTATSGTVSAAVLAERHKKFEIFMDLLRGDNPPEKSQQPVRKPK